jgi:hypothetical protein
MRKSTSLRAAGLTEGGRWGIIFHEDIHHEWVGPAEVYTAIGDDGDDIGGGAKEEADTK